jgi:hypothetical protein
MRLPHVMPRSLAPREAPLDIPGITDEDEFTRLSEFHPDRVDLVKNAANGTRFLITKHDASAGLLDPDFVRDLIAKTSPEEAPVPHTTEAGETVLANGIVIKGSPAAMAAFIHAASERTPTPADVAKAKYSAEERRQMASSGQAMDGGEYPIADADDLDKAIRAVGRGGDSHNAIRKHVMARAKALGKSSEIPDNWNSDGSLKGGVSKEAGVPSTVAKADPMDTAGDAVMLDDGIDGLDPTVPLAAPGEADAPGDPTDPGSPAWEAIDAATAQKWLSIAARLKNALGILAEREMTEAAVADPADAENAFDLQDAMCAVDFAIEQLAVFAAGEQAEAELGAECEAMCKALAGFDLAPLGILESLAPASAAVRKAGRVLSSANEAKLRSAAQAIGEVLSSLPPAPEGVAKSKEAPVPAVKDQAAEVAKEASPQAPADGKAPATPPGTTGIGEPRDTGPAAALPADGPQAAMPGDVPGRTVVKSARLPVLVYDRGGRECKVRPDAILDPVAKADDGDGGKPPMQAVFDENGTLIGIVDPADITPVSGTGKKADPDPGEAAPAPPADDMTPQPPADAGVPADAVGKAAGEDVITLSRDVLKSIAADAAREALEAQGAANQEVVAKMAADNGELREELKVVKARLETVESMPAAPGVFTNGARPPADGRPVPPAEQLRGQNAGAPAVDVAKAAERRREFLTADPARQNALAVEMQRDMIASLAAIHGTPA